MNRLKFSFNSRWDSLAMVSNTIDDFPDPETPVKIVILRLGMRSETFFKLFSRAPRISMYSWGTNSLLIRSLVQFQSCSGVGQDLFHLGGAGHVERCHPASVRTTGGSSHSARAWSMSSAWGTKR